MEAAWWWKWTITQSARSGGGSLEVVLATYADSCSVYRDFLTSVNGDDGSLTHSSEERSCCPEDKSLHPDEEHGATV